MNTPESTDKSAGFSKAEQGKRRSILWRVGRFCLLGFVTLVTLFALYHVEENWRGKRAWNQYKERMEAQGAVFEFKKLAPPPVPDDENFAMTPLLKPLLDQYPPDTFDAEGNLLTWRDPEGKARAEAIDVEDPDLNASSPYGGMPGEAVQGPPPAPRRAEWRLGERIDLAEWQRYYAASTNFPSWAEPRTPAEDVLKALSRYDPELDELKQASHRPYSRFDIRYEQKEPYSILLTHLSVLRDIAKVVQLRAVAELEAGQVDVAFDDVQLMFVLTDSIRDEPLVINHLVRLALLKLTLQTIWEGMADHRWDAAQLEVFQRHLESVNFAIEVKRAIQAERAMGAAIVELGTRDPTLFLNLDGSGGTEEPFRMAMYLVPRGWWYLEGLNNCRAFDKFILSALPDDYRDLDARRVDASSEEQEAWLEEGNDLMAVLRHKVLARLLLPALGKAVMISVEGQTLAEMAVVAMGLERYRLQYQAYPAQLSQLVPKFAAEIPQDPVSHQPFHYERIPTGGFRLWSVGWNGVDDGGLVEYRSDGPTRTPVRDQPDWVWPSINGMKLKETTE